MIRIIKILMWTGLFAVLSGYFYHTQLAANGLSWSDFVNQMPWGKRIAQIEPFVPPTPTSTELIAAINAARTNQQLTPLWASPQLTEIARGELIATQGDVNYLSSSAFTQALQDKLMSYGYAFDTIVTFTATGSFTADDLLAEPELAAEISHDIFSTIAIAHQTFDQADVFLILLASDPLLKAAQPSITPNPPTPSSQPPSAAPKRDIPDDEVVAALNAYRKTHGVDQLKINQHLCAYAQKRVEDLRQVEGLDNHAGFRADFADPQQVPPQLEEYDKSRIGENLAYQYCRNMQTQADFYAQTGTALIEWCFDSSTKGHREAQLDPTFEDVCVRHADHKYVVIFGGD